MKKGFTLIEMIAVVLIMALLTLVIMPTVLNQIRSQKGNVSEKSLQLIYEANELYLEERTNEYPMYYGGTYCISLETLVNAGKLKNPVKDLATGKEIALNKVVKTVVNKYKDGEYALVDAKDCKTVIVDVPSTLVYGVRRSLKTESSAWERIGESIGLEANAQIGTTSVRNDFDYIYPWSDIISYNYNTDTKKITAYYGDTNFKFDGSNGEVLTYIPEFYYKRYQDEDYEYIYISKEQTEGYTKSEAFSVGRYTMSGDATRVHSKSGVAPFTGKTITNFRTYARNLGEDFGQLDYHYFILQLLYLVEYADYNSQAKLGLGYTNGSQTAPINSGGCDSLGMHSGSVDGTDNSSVIYRGIEDIFGNVWQFVDGINIKDYQAYICYDKSQYQANKYDGCYQRLGYTNTSTHKEWVSKLGYDRNHPLVAFPIETNGSNDTYMTDNYSATTGNRIVLIGGRYGLGFYAGLWYWNGHDASSSAGTLIGARLIRTN